MTPSRFVASFINARLKTGQLNQDDIELIRTLLKQGAFGWLNYYGHLIALLEDKPI